jgi:hypothetical protein
MDIAGSPDFKLNSPLPLDGQCIGVQENPLAPPTLAQAGINKNLAHRARKFGRMEGQGLVKRKSL